MDTSYLHFGWRLSFVVVGVACLVFGFVCVFCFGVPSLPKLDIGISALTTVTIVMMSAAWKQKKIVACLLSVTFFLRLSLPNIRKTNFQAFFRPVHPVLKTKNELRLCIAESPVQFLDASRSTWSSDPCSLRFSLRFDSFKCVPFYKLVSFLPTCWRRVIQIAILWLFNVLHWSKMPVEVSYLEVQTRMYPISMFETDRHVRSTFRQTKCLRVQRKCYGIELVFRHHM